MVAADDAHDNIALPGDPPPLGTLTERAERLGLARAFVACRLPELHGAGGAGCAAASSAARSTSRRAVV